MRRAQRRRDLRGHRRVRQPRGAGDADRGDPQRASTADAGRRAERPRLRRAARPLYGPLTVSGLSARTRQLVARAARRTGRLVLAAPPGPLGGYPAADLRPGSAVSAAVSTGDVSLGAAGTVAYRDGDEIFAFGHALDGLGKRAIFLQDTYVFGVIGNPLGVPDFGAITYKLTSSRGHPLGAFTNDTLAAVAGSLGAGPPAIPLRVAARERGRGDSVTLNSLLADERELQLGAGLSLVAPLAASTAIDRLLRTFEPVTLTACTRFRVRRLRRPIGFCNPYFDSFSAVFDIAEAAALVDDFGFAPLEIESAGISIAARRGVVDDVLVGADAARRRVRPGSRLSARVRLRRRGGGRRSVTVRVPVPRDLRPGRRTLLLSGNGFPLDEFFFIELIAGELAGAGAGTRSGRAAGPRTVRGLGRRVAALRRPLGVTARFRRRDEPRVVLRSSDVRFDGRVELRLRVLAARR